MSPIKPENRHRYPKNWPEISATIRARSQGQCECEGECGLHQPQHVRSTNVGFCDGAMVPRRCEEQHGEKARWARGKIVLTVHHLNFNPADNRPENLKAMCQRCHLRCDLPHHRANSAKTRNTRKFNLSLFPDHP